MKAAPKPCGHPGCGVLVSDGTARCDRHKVKPGSFADRRRGSRQSRGYGAEWDRKRSEIIARDTGLCQACLRAGRVTEGREVDHITPKSRGGSDDVSNLQLLCRACHKTKTQHEAAEARKALGAAE